MTDHFIIMVFYLAGVNKLFINNIQYNNCIILYIIFLFEQYDNIKLLKADS